LYVYRASNFSKPVAGNFASAIVVRFFFLCVQKVRRNSATFRLSNQFVQEGAALRRGWSLWQDEVNARGIRVNNITYGVNITVFDIGGSLGTAQNQTLKIARGDFGQYDYIFGS
jgi:hypothetical protein